MWYDLNIPLQLPSSSHAVTTLASKEKLMNQQKITFRFIIGIALIVTVLIVVILLLPQQTFEERQAIVSARQAQLVQALADQRANERKAIAERVKQGRQNTADDVVRSILYVQDSRTTPPTCYAHCPSKKYNYDNGPALAAVPCGSIPPNLLIVANVK